jgi:hypothetical protein
VERILIVNSKDDESFMGAPSTMVQGGKGVKLPVVNPSSRPRLIHKGERLGILHDPDRYLDREEANDSGTRNREAIALAMKKLASSGPARGRELIGTPMRSTAGELSALEDPKAKEESWGPKISESGDPSTINYKDFESAFDISNDMPAEIRSQLLNKGTTWEWLGEHKRAFELLKVTLGVKEALVKFQPFIEGEKIIVITDHAALVWSRTYENAN